MAPKTLKTADTRRAAERRGRRADAHAAWLLRLKGYRVLARRYRCPAGEIDIVARRGALIATVEVKVRADLDAAAFVIDAQQRARIARASEHFLAANPAYSNHAIRFDAILAAPGRWPRHIPDAWRID
jgi:putative endonuclease